ncbi:unnamed protein product [marine sediment metagenome]|uniref:Uncharacterized protein n=1 Tax=marine sediment metagenome TaxID=412755 RepID=X0T0F9_9ZZZZ
MIPGDIVKKKRNGHVLFEVLEVIKDAQPVGIKVRPLDHPTKAAQVFDLATLVVVDPLDALGEQSGW